MLNRLVLARKTPRCSRRFFCSLSEPVAELDRVLLRHFDTHKSPILTKHLRSDDATHTRFGRVQHNALIGLRERDLVATDIGTKLSVHHLTLAEYIELTPRAVTPIYPAYASLITSLLDIHLTPTPTPSSSTPITPSFEVLEAGTGHGGLTLYLARALTAGNPPVPPSVQAFIKSSRSAPVLSPSPEEEAYRSTRSAVLHTIDIEPGNSAHAQNIVRNFRRGIYFPTVDFHVGRVRDWLEQRLASLGRESLAHIILDLPGVRGNLAPACEALQTAGSLVVFVPSITQVAECVRLVNRERLQLVLERVVEVGTGMAAGREWDLREVTVRPPREKRDKDMVRRGVNKEVEIQYAEDGKETSEGESGSPESDVEIKDDGLEDSGGAEPASDARSNGSSEVVSSRKEMVCRPKAGFKTSGGGFIGIWRKKRQREDMAS